MEKRSHIIQSIRNFKDIENQVNLDINRIVRNSFQLIKPKVTCVIINDNNDQLINSIKKEMKIFDEIFVANIQKESFTNKINCFLSKNKIQCYQYDNKQEIQNDGRHGTYSNRRSRIIRRTRSNRHRKNDSY